MDLEAQFPLRFYINLAFREDRRADLELEFLHHRFEAERFPAADARWMRRAGKFSRKGWSALALTLRMLLREAERRRAESVLVFEDDVTFHPALRQRLAAITLPEDWGLFYLGCQHINMPLICGAGLVRCVRAVDMQAVAIQARYFRAVREALAHPERLSPRATLANDQAVAELHATIPSYAAFPNLAWQRRSYSNAQGCETGPYDEAGNQLNVSPVEGLAVAMKAKFFVGAPSSLPP